MTDLQKELFSLRDEEYKAFHSKLMPTVNPENIIGVRVPQLRKFAKGFSKSKASAEFINELPHKYYEENNVHAFIVSEIMDFDAAVYETQRFLPFIDNWATCDMFVPKAFKKSPQKLLPYIFKWIESDHTYTVRFAIKMLMDLFLGDNYSQECAETVAAVKSDEYYVNTMIAWYFATALTKNYDRAVVFLQKHKLSVWTHNKAIQKAIESYRIPKETKDYLRTLKIK